jgi:hypothetical protein
LPILEHTVSPNAIPAPYPNLAAVRAAAEQLTRAIHNPADPAVRCEAARLNNEEDRLTTVVDHPDYRPVPPAELDELVVLQILGERLWGLLDPDAPGATQQLPRPVRESLHRLRVILSKSAWALDLVAGPPEEPAVAVSRHDLLLALDAVTSPDPGQADVGGQVVLVAGGFEYAGRSHTLTGRPRAMLAALLAARGWRMTALAIRDALEVSDVFVGFPEQVVRDTAYDLRRALRAACAAVGRECVNPLPSTGRGADLTYRLDMP